MKKNLSVLVVDPKFRSFQEGGWEDKFNLQSYSVKTRFANSNGEALREIEHADFDVVFLPKNAWKGDVKGMALSAKLNKGDSHGILTYYTRADISNPEFVKKRLDSAWSSIIDKEKSPLETKLRGLYERLNLDKKKIVKLKNAETALRAYESDNIPQILDNKISHELQHRHQEHWVEVQKLFVHSNTKISRNWFNARARPLANSIDSLVKICTLPSAVRGIITYPAVGEYLQSQLQEFRPRTKAQKEFIAYMYGIIEDRKWYNDHMQDTTLIGVEAAAECLAKYVMKRKNRVEEFKELYDYLKCLKNKFSKDVYSVDTEKTTTDVGHGLISHYNDFISDLTSFYEIIRERGIKSSDLVIMVVDDEKPEYWYNRLRSVGFREKEGQKGFFENPYDALKALEEGDYDVILTDIEMLGMDGIEFAKKAYSVQKDKGKIPVIQVFSHSEKALAKADYPLSPKTFNQGEHNIVISQPLGTKSDFSALEFLEEAEQYVKREKDGS